MSTAAPKRGAWVTITLTDGRELVCRFVCAGQARMDANRQWCVDRGAYGPFRDDSYIRESGIASVAPSERPPLLLSFVDPHGKRIRVGWYMTHEDAERAMAPMRRFAADIRVEVQA